MKENYMSFMIFYSPKYSLSKDRTDETPKPAPAADLPTAQPEKKQAEAVP